MATYWEIAAHSVKDMFSMYSYLIVNLYFLDFSRLGIGATHNIQALRLMILEEAFCILYPL